MLPVLPRLELFVEHSTFKDYHTGNILTLTVLYVTPYCMQQIKDILRHETQTGVYITSMTSLLPSCLSFTSHTQCNDRITHQNISKLLIKNAHNNICFGIFLPSSVAYQSQRSLGIFHLKTQFINAQ